MMKKVEFYSQYSTDLWSDPEQITSSFITQVKIPNIRNYAIL